MTNEQQKVMSERLATVEKKERELWRQVNETRDKANAIASEWMVVSNELDFLKLFIAIPTMPVQNI